MKKYKVCVYAIAKNEEQFVERWMNSIKDADLIVVLDTGSTDNTVEKLKEMGAVVKVDEINPWRFDVARNKVLDLIDDDVDICISLDLDEVLNPRWREELEKTWDEKTNKLSVNLIWNYDEFDNPGMTYTISRIHDRKNYKWFYPVHEITKYVGQGNEINKINKNIVIGHHPDPNKSRSSYLELLELAVLESPLDDRCMHYLGREYMYQGMWDKAINILHKHLKLESSCWKEERCASMRFISKSYINIGRIEEATMWLEKAIDEAPFLREPYVELAFLKDSSKEYSEVIFLLSKALEILERGNAYINEQYCRDSTIYDLLSIASYHLDNYDDAIKYVDIAIEMEKANKRLKNNKKIYIEAQEK